MHYLINTIAILFLLKWTGTVSQLNYSQMTQFLLLTSIDGYNACPYGALAFKSYVVDSFGSCAFDCKTLPRRITSSTSATCCVGFNYLEKNSTCQLYTNSQRLYFVPQPHCRYFKNVEFVGPAPSIPVCPATFTFVPSAYGCYKAMLINKDWSPASQICASLVPGGHLAFINSSTGQTAIQSFLSSITPTGCNSYGTMPGVSWYIGGQFLDPSASQSPFYWKVDQATPAAPVTYSYWLPGNPDFPGSEKCISVISSSSYQWNTVTCSASPLCFICQLSL